MKRAKMERKLDLLGDLMGRVAYVEQGYIAEVVGVHIYVSKNGVKSVRIHLKNIHGYFRLEDVISWL